MRDRKQKFVRRLLRKLNLNGQGREFYTICLLTDFLLKVCKCWGNMCTLLIDSVSDGQMPRTTYLVLDLGYGTKKQVFLVLAPLLSDPKHYDISSRLQCFTYGLWDQLVFAYALSELLSAQHWVRLLVDVLVCALVHAIFAIVDHVFRGVSLW